MTNTYINVNAPFCHTHRQQTTWTVKVDENLVELHQKQVTNREPTMTLVTMVAEMATLPLV